MLINISLSNTMQEKWQHPIRRQVDYKLASKESSIRVLTVKLEKTKDEAHKDVYECFMQARLLNGSVEQVKMTGAPHMSIADAAARLSRQIGRNVQQKQQGRISLT